MIKKECFTTEWIEQVASKLHYNDKNIIEKVIRALSLLEMLVKAGCPLVYKGGTALFISTRGKAGEGDFNLIQDGIIRVKSFMYKQRYLIDNAIIDAARTAYLATLIEKGITEVECYSNNPADIKDLVILPSLTNKLNKLKNNLPEAFYYWAKTSKLLEA